MSTQITKALSSSRIEVAGGKFYDKFLETLMTICAEEDVCRVPQIVVVDKSGAQIVEPETISRKLFQIAASLEKAKVQRALRKTATLQELRKSYPSTSTAEVQGAVPETDTKKEDAPAEKAILQQDIGDAEVGDQISVPVMRPQEEVSRQRKGQMRIISGRPETLTAVAVRSSRIESALLRSIGRCLSSFTTISQLRFENCRLKPEDVYLIALVLRETDSLKQLILDENPLGDMCYSCLLQMSSQLQLLSLCGCGMGDLGIIYLFAGLEHTGNTSHSLVRLNLASNLITCKGAQILANALRTNRALLSVSLSGNQVKNTGAIALAEVFQRFKLRHDECIERRGRYFSQNMKQSSRKSIIEDTYPFLIELEREAGAQYCKGNFTLMHLNLSYNSIGLPGLLAFHQAVLYQETVLQPPDKGLLSLYFQGNTFPEDRPELEEMLRIFDARLDSHRKSSKTGSLESARISSKTSLSKTSLKSRELEKSN